MRQNPSDNTRAAAGESGETCENRKHCAGAKRPVGPRAQTHREQHIKPELSVPRPHAQCKKRQRRNRAVQRVRNRGKAAPPHPQTEGLKKVIDEAQRHPRHQRQRKKRGLLPDSDLHYPNNLLQRLPEGAVSS